MFRENELAGLLAFESLFVVNAAVGLATTLSLYVVLRRVNESLMAISLVLGFVEAITIILARPAVEMLYLSERYAAATTDAQRAALLGAGEAMWAVAHGTAFHVGYNLFSVYLVIVAVVMLRSGVFGRVTAYAGILAAILNWGLYVPGIGVLLSVLGVFPFFVIWNVLVGWRLLQLGRAEGDGRVAPSRRGGTAMWWADLLWGFWNGLTAWVVLVVHVFGGWEQFPFYNEARSGNWYDFGFLLGAGSPLLGTMGRRGG